MPVLVLLAKSVDRVKQLTALSAAAGQRGACAASPGICGASGVELHSSSTRPAVSASR